MKHYICSVVNLVIGVVVMTDSEVADGDDLK
jgi:hypothetical protein